MSNLKTAGIVLATILGLGILAGIYLAAKAIGFVVGMILFFGCIILAVWYGVKYATKKPST